MTLTMLGGLALLALVDSTSFGTLGVPVWMLAQQRVRVVAVLTYLAVISAFYWALGLALLAGARPVIDLLDSLSSTRVVLWIQLTLGVGLFVLSFRLDSRRAKARRAQRVEAGGNHSRWLHRVTGETARLRDVGVIALLAGCVEAASMLPYLGAVGLLSTSTLSWPAQSLVLLGYVVVMVLPPLALLAGRLVAARALAPTLSRIIDWMQRSSGSALGWVVGILGFLLAADALQQLGP